MLLASALFPTALPALLLVQQPPVRTLGPVQVEFAEPFTSARGVRELRDGRVIVLDVRDQSIHLVDFRTQSSTPIGRQGDGPGEYRLPLQLYALPGDSSAVHDMARPQGLLIITPDGKAGGFISTSGDPPGSSPLFTPRDTDRLGRYYAIDHSGSPQPVRVAPGQTRAAPDSQRIVRIDRRSGQRELVARVSLQLFRPEPLPAPTRPGPAPPFSSVTQWAVDESGRVAVVSVQPYQVSSTLPDGRRLNGPVLAADRIRVTAAHREAWLDQRRQPAPTISATPGGGREYGMRRMPFPDPDVWPDFLPPFLFDAVRFAPDGLLWIHRTATADAPPTYDLIDEAGRIATRLTLPPRTRLVGFGPRSVYLVRLDADDLEYLQRYPLPVR